MENKAGLSKRVRLISSALLVVVGAALLWSLVLSGENLDPLPVMALMVIVVVNFLSVLQEIEKWKNERDNAGK